MLDKLKDFWEKDNKRRTFIWLCIIVLAPVILWNIIYPSGDWKYKTTVTVETPEGVVVGEAVRKVSYHTEPTILPPQGGTYWGIVEGEAVVVDLGQDRILFALQDSGDLYRYILENLRKYEDKKHLMKKLGIQVSLPRRHWPRFVTFTDFSDPTSVVQVTQGNIDDLFGAGVIIKDVTIEMTDEPVTHKIHQYMPSYNDMDAFMNWFRGLSFDDPRRFGPDSLKRGK